MFAQSTNLFLFLMQKNSAGKWFMVWGIQLQKKQKKKTTTEKTLFTLNEVKCINTKTT